MKARGGTLPIRICYSQEDDADFVRWSSNLLRAFLDEGSAMLVRQHDQPDLMLTGIWKNHLFPDIPVVLLCNENWRNTTPPCYPLERYLAVIAITRPPEACTYIPLPYAAVHLDEKIGWLYENRHRALAAPKSRFCCFVAANTRIGEWTGRRLQLAHALEALGRVDFAGPADNNTGYLAPRGLAFLNWISNYKYMICLENSSDEGYITEKPLQAWLGGAVPIYDGGAKSLLDPRAFIDAAGDVAAAIRRLEADPSAYEAMRRTPLTRTPFSLDLFERQFREKVLGPLLEAKAKRPPAYLPAWHPGLRSEDGRR